MNKPASTSFSPISEGRSAKVKSPGRHRAIGWSIAVLMMVTACSPENTVDPGSTTSVGPGGATSTTRVSTGPATTNATTTTTLPLDPPRFDALDGINTVLDFAESYVVQGSALWERSLTGLADVRIPSTADGSDQEAVWIAPSGDRPMPLLVVLHSWSASYLQHASIPFALWAEDNGWAFIAPNFRGANNRPEAIGSDLAVQDVADAIAFAIDQEGVDSDRVYVIGFSGGGMMSLLVAGRHPELVTAVSAWTPVYDLIEFYRHSRAIGQRYADHIVRGCGGTPTTNEGARDRCLQRSPMTHLDNAVSAGVPVYIAQGLHDSLVPPSQAARAFNQLADPPDRITDDALTALGRNRLLDSLRGQIGVDTFFGTGDPPVAFATGSNGTVLVIFDAGHEMAYAPALHWFATDPR